MQIISLLILQFAVFGQNLIVNGGFEDLGSQYCLSNNCWNLAQAAIAPWTVTSDWKKVELVARAVWPAWGNWSMDLTSTQPVTISQSVTLIPQNLYVLSLKLNQNAACGNTTGKPGFVSVTGSPTGYFKHRYVSGVPWADQWKNYTYLFRAVSANTTISIGSLVPALPGDCGPAVDEITLRIFSSGCAI